VAEILRLHRPDTASSPPTYAAAVDRYLADAGISTGSVRVYRIALTTWSWLLAGQQPPPGRARRGATPPTAGLAVLDDPATHQTLAAAFAARLAAGTDADTANRELSILRAALSWWRAQGWVHADPTLGLARRPAPADQTRALTRDQVAALLALQTMPGLPPAAGGKLQRVKVGLRERTYWRLLYETAARAEEILNLNIGDLDLPNKRARVISKGGQVEWVHYESGAAALLPRLLAGRAHPDSPVFLTDRRASARTPRLDVCPVTRRARLSYRRAAELFERATAQLDREGAGWTLHQLRHSQLTHEAETGTSTPMLLAISRHASVRSLERYARPGPEAVARHVAERDPAARRRGAR
jgi:integrase/recombinase XerD